MQLHNIIIQFKYLIPSGVNGCGDIPPTPVVVVVPVCAESCRPNRRLNVFTTLLTRGIEPPPVFMLARLADEPLLLRAAGYERPVVK